MMYIGDKLVYPQPIAVENTANQAQPHSGLTYREWLIGMLASNSSLVALIAGYNRDKNIRDNARVIIQQADEIIRLMHIIKEEENNASIQFELEGNSESAEEK